MKTWISGMCLALILAGCATSAPPQYKEMLVVGDAVSCCAPIPEVGWTHDWGMAATGRDRDYVHRLFAELKKNSPALKLTIDSIMYQDTMTGWVHLVPCSADLIVIQLGENYQGGISLEEYGDAYGQMIEELCEGGEKTVVCLGPWKNAPLEPVIAQAAANHGAIYLSLQGIRSDPANLAAADGKYPKLGDMPGDLGMKKIAEAVYDALGKTTKGVVKK